MARCERTGLRVGALRALAIRGERFTTTTKASEEVGMMPEDVRRKIERAELPLRAPFAALTAGNLTDRFFYPARKLHNAGKLGARSSVHDLRHAFALRLYQQNRDVYLVRVAFGHANVSVTEKYLRSLGLEG